MSQTNLQIETVVNEEPGLSWVVLFADGRGLWLFRKRFARTMQGVVPRVDDVITIDGAADLGGRIDDLDLNGKRLYRRSHRDRRADRRSEHTPEDRRQLASFAAQFVQVRTRISELPAPLRARLAFLRQTEPEERQAWRALEFALCVDAHQVAEFVRVQNGWTGTKVPEEQAARAVQAALPSAQILGLHPAHDAHTLRTVGYLAMALLAGGPAY